MPNGRTHHCGYCCHLDASFRQCTLRNIPIFGTHWTSCRNCDTPADAPTGPLYAIVCEVRNRGAVYATIPYWGDARPELIQAPGALDTYVRVALPGRTLRFETVLEYLETMEREGMLPADG